MKLVAFAFVSILKSFNSNLLLLSLEKIAGIRQGFFSTSQQAKNEERKQNATSSNLMSPSNQHFSQQQQNKQQKIIQKAITPTSQEKPRKQVKSALHQEVSEFNPFGQLSIELAHQSGIKPPGRGQEALLRKENTKLTELINNGLQDTLDLRMANQEREIESYETNNVSSSTKRTLKFKECKKKMFIWRTSSQVKEANPVNKTQKIQILGKRIKKKYNYFNRERHLYKNFLKFHNFKKQY